MHTHTQGSGRRWRMIMGVLVALCVPTALVTLEEACSSSAAPPPELSAQGDGSIKEAAPGPKPEPTPEPTPEAGCMPLAEGGAVITSTSMAYSDGGLYFGNDGQVPCGSQAQPETLVIQNNTCAPITYMTSLTSGGSYYAVTPPTGTIPALMSQTITLSPNPVPQISAVTPDLYEGTLSITTTASGDPGHIVQLHETAYGAILTSTEFGSTITFTNVPIGKTVSDQFSITNLGNAATTVLLGVGSQYYSVGTGDGGAPDFTIPAGLGVTPVVSFSPTAVTPYSDTITVTPAMSPPLCATAPQNIQLSGNGATAVTLSTNTLNFGFSQCGQPALAAKSFTIMNTGPAMTYTMAFGLGSSTFYTLEDSMGNALTTNQPIALGASSNVTINVVPKPIPSTSSTTNDAFGDVLTISTTSPMDTMHTVTLTETAQGAIFTMPSSLNASSGQGTVQQQFTVGNTGNYQATYTLAIVPTSPAPGNTFTTNIPPGTIVAPTSQTTGTMTFIPPTSDAFEQFSGTMTVVPAAGSILCAQVPPPTDLTVAN